MAQNNQQQAVEGFLHQFSSETTQSMRRLEIFAKLEKGELKREDVDDAVRVDGVRPVVFSEHEPTAVVHPVPGEVHHVRKNA